jgi:ubiquinone biosynthesis protein Coq4
LEQQEIAPWVNTSVTVVRSDGNVHVLTQKTLSLQLKETQKLPMEEEIITCSKMKGTKYFSLFVLINVYWEVKLNKSCAELHVFNTPWE